LSASLVTTIDKQGNATLGDVHLTFLPASVYAYNIGVITLMKKSNWMQD
jgi:hypothetical protein